MTGVFAVASLGECDGIAVGDGTVGRDPAPGSVKRWSAIRLVPMDTGRRDFQGCRLGFTYEEWPDALAKARAHKKNMPDFKYMVLADYFKIAEGSIVKISRPEAWNPEPKAQSKD
jgi:hypothetical protein